MNDMDTKRPKQGLRGLALGLVLLGTAGATSCVIDEDPFAGEKGVDVENESGPPEKLSCVSYRIG